jgi:hypothetical protein
VTELRIVSEPRGDAGDATFVREGLALFNVAVTGNSYYSPLTIFLKDERGAVLGGVERPRRQRDPSSEEMSSPMKVYILPTLAKRGGRGIVSWLLAPM